MSTVHQAWSTELLLNPGKLPIVLENTSCDCLQEIKLVTRTYDCDYVLY